MIINFFNHDHSFCEALLYDGPPEYINSITSLYITYIGYYGLRYNSHPNNNIFLLYSALLINGILSFAYHWTNIIGFGLLDRFSMILIAYPAVITCFEELYYLYNINIYEQKICWILMQIYFTLIITMCGLGYEEIFNGLFGIFLGGNIIFLYMVYKKKQRLDNKIHRLIIKGFIGLLMLVLAGIGWITVEKFCHNYYILRYLHGHAIWHICVSLGGYYLTMLLAGVNLGRKNLLPFYYITNDFITKK